MSPAKVLTYSLSACAVILAVSIASLDGLTLLEVEANINSLGEITSKVTIKANPIK